MSTCPPRTPEKSGRRNGLLLAAGYLRHRVCRVAVLAVEAAGFPMARAIRGLAIPVGRTPRTFRDPTILAVRITPAPAEGVPILLAVVPVGRITPAAPITLAGRIIPVGRAIPAARTTRAAAVQVQTWPVLSLALILMAPVPVALALQAAVVEAFPAAVAVAVAFPEEPEVFPVVCRVVREPSAGCPEPWAACPEVRAAPEGAGPEWLEWPGWAAWAWECPWAPAVVTAAGRKNANAPPGSPKMRMSGSAMKKPVHQ